MYKFEEVIGLVLLGGAREVTTSCEYHDVLSRVLDEMDNSHSKIQSYVLML